ncbi:MAG: mannose-6-phosphate isomerase, class I, partial [Actinomycetales bacterium]|nr:mannose-6-phosphate isomerase, class I [Actinomycetales bacterium]
TRNYKDRNHKPELIVALSPTFDALCGFRPREETLRVLREFTEMGRASGSSTQFLEAFAGQLVQQDTDEAAMTWALEWLLTGAAGVQELVRECVELAALLVEAPSASSRVSASIMAESETVRELAAEYPGDPGIVLALLLNRVRLSRGEALYLPAGNMHAYLRGLGVELMASSDNVLRGGLTPKHIDVAELLAITQCQPLPIPALLPTVVAAGVEIFAPAVDDFALLHVLLTASVNGGRASVDFDGPAIIICTEGELVVTGDRSSTVLLRGEFFFVTPDEGAVTFNGFGEIFAARRGFNPAFGQ